MEKRFIQKKYNTIEFFPEAKSLIIHHRNGFSTICFQNRIYEFICLPSIDRLSFRFNDDGSELVFDSSLFSDEDIQTIYGTLLLWQKETLQAQKKSSKNIVES